MGWTETLGFSHFPNSASSPPQSSNLWPGKNVALHGLCCASLSPVITAFLNVISLWCGATSRVSGVGPYINDVTPGISINTHTTHVLFFAFCTLSLSGLLISFFHSMGLYEGPSCTGATADFPYRSFPTMLLNVYSATASIIHLSVLFCFVFICWWWSSLEISDGWAAVS